VEQTSGYSMIQMRGSFAPDLILCSNLSQLVVCMGGRGFFGKFKNGLCLHYVPIQFGRHAGTNKKIEFSVLYSSNPWSFQSAFLVNRIERHELFFKFF
jgi:hypothetical protein